MTTASGCPKRPSWAITAARVIDDPATGKVRFIGGHLQLFGVTVPLLPIFAFSRGKGGRDRLARAGLQHFEQEGLRDRRALPLADRAEPRPDADAPRLHRRLPGDRGEVPAARPLGRISGRRVPDLRNDRKHRPERHLDPQGRPRLFRSERQGPARPAVEHHDLAPGRERQDPHPPLRHHQRRPAAQRHQCRADQPQQLHLHRRLGVRRAACRGQAKADPDRASGDRRALPQGGRRSAARFKSRATASTSSGSRARIRSAPSRAREWDLRRLTPWGQELTLTGLRARRRLSHRRGGEHAGADLQRHQRLAHESDRRARRRPEMAVDRPAVRRHPALVAAGPAGAHPTDAEHRHPQRGCALDRPRGQQPVRAQSLPRLRPLGGRVAAHLRRRLVARAAQPLDHHHDRPELSARRPPGNFPARHGAYRPLVGYRRKNPHSLRPASSISPTGSESTRTISQSAATRSTSPIGTSQTYAQIGYLKPQP